MASAGGFMALNQLEQQNPGMLERYSTVARWLGVFLIVLIIIVIYEMVSGASTSGSSGSGNKRCDNATVMVTRPQSPPRRLCTEAYVRDDCGVGDGDGGSFNSSTGMFGSSSAPAKVVVCPPNNNPSPATPPSSLNQPNDAAAAATTNGVKNKPNAPVALQSRDMRTTAPVCYVQRATAC